MRSRLTGLAAIVAALTFAVQPTLAQVKPPPPAGEGDAASKPKELEALATPEAVAAAITHAGVGCEVTNSSEVNRAEDSVTYEVACAAGNGLIARIDLPVSQDSRVQTMTCVTAAKNAATNPDLYACKLTTPEANQAYEANALQRYTDMAREAGIPCQVDKFNTYPRRDGINHDTVEVRCASSNLSAVVMTGDVNSVLSCGRALAEGYRCGFSKQDTWLDPLTRALREVYPADTTCNVTNLAPIGVSNTSAYLEVTCSDGTPGYVMKFPLGNAKAEAAWACSTTAAKSINGGCKLPENIKAIADAGL